MRVISYGNATNPDDFLALKLLHPDFVKNQKKIFQPETTDNEPLLEFTIRIKCARITDELMRLKKFVDTSIWFQGPAQVDAYYAPNLNEMS